MDTSPLPDPLKLRSFIEKSKTPVVFKLLISEWEILSWSLEAWANKFGNKTLPFRSAVISPTKGPLWEGECKTIHLTMHDFIKQTDLIKTSPTSSDAKQWLYFDYKHMVDWFQDNPDILETVSWGKFGFPQRKGAESTVWIGSSGAHTACHLDTYGFNLIAQVYGRKRWILFPPEATASMLPTRVPYEESSIYSSRNFSCPELSLADELRDAHIITLNPGDVLLVPYHWWHFVENLDTAISINTWVPLHIDDVSRLDESLVRFFVSQISKDLPEPQLLLNPNEMDLVDCPLSVLVDQIRTSLSRLKEPGDEVFVQEPKKAKFDGNETSNSERETSQMSMSYSNLIEDWKHFIAVVPKCTKKEFQDILVEKRTLVEDLEHLSNKDTVIMAEDKSQNGFITEIVNSFCHPDVISLIRKKIVKVNCSK